MSKDGLPDKLNITIQITIDRHPDGKTDISVSDPEIDESPAGSFDSLEPDVREFLLSRLYREVEAIITAERKPTGRENQSQP